MNVLTKTLSVLVLLGASAGVASAAEKVWMGKDGNGYRYTYTHLGGKSWTESINGERGRCSEVTRTGEYIELRLDGAPSQRTRLYKDKFYLWSEKSRDWVYMGSGRWTE